jgi:dihydrofolate synthase/folylpolyglutamate synthase
MVFQDERGLLDLPLPNLPGRHQVENAGAVLAALRHLGADEAACEAAVTRAYWPARMERLTKGALVDLARPAELWLDGGHNPHAGRALAETLTSLPPRPTHLICGMLNTKDIGGYLRPLAGIAQSLTAVSIPGEANTLPAETTAEKAGAAGLAATVAGSVQEAIAAITARDANARILICGSLYLAGHVMRENGA